MYYILNAAIKGVLEGFTEFLPISSTGHLVLVRDLLPLTENAAQAKRLDDLFDIVIQFPAVLAIVILYRKRLTESVLGITKKKESKRFWTGLFVAFLPVAMLGMLCKDWIEKYLMFPKPIALALIAGGLILILIERSSLRESIASAESVPLSTALAIGVFQCLGMIPGTSRSGATIVGGRMLGLSRTAAAEYSFFLALPTMAGAFTYKFLKAMRQQQIHWDTDGAVLLVGCATSFLTAWAVVSVFMRMIESKHGLSMWGWYRIALGGLVLLLGTSKT